MSSLKEHKPNLKNQTNFNKIIGDVLEHKPSNITHNGLVVPKKENSLEYNLFLKFILDFLKESKILGIVDRFISPPQLRIKFGKTKKRKILMHQSILILMRGPNIIQIKVILYIFQFLVIIKITM